MKHFFCRRFMLVWCPPFRASRLSAFWWLATQRVPGYSVPLTAINKFKHFLIPAIFVGSDVNHQLGVRSEIHNQLALNLVQPHELFVEPIAAFRIDFYSADIVFVNFR